MMSEIDQSPLPDYLKNKGFYVTDGYKWRCSLNYGDQYEIKKEVFPYGFDVNFDNGVMYFSIHEAMLKIDSSNMNNFWVISYADFHTLWLGFLDERDAIHAKLLVG